MSLALGLIGYWFLAYAVKSVTYPRDREPPRPFPRRWDTGHESTIFFSIDFWFANVFKNRIKQFERRSLRSSLKEYIQLNNKVNLLVSACMFLALIAAYHADDRSLLYQVLLAMSLIRYLSRSYEIAFAFGRDVLQGRRRQSGLDKYERIRLALMSYMEVFIYSSAAYLALPLIKDPMDALSMSLNVGTLTNVGYAFGADATLFSNLVFVQVFCTLSLVVLSLASYLSREK